MLLDTTPLTSDGEDAVSFQRDTRDMSADEGTPPPERLTNFFITDILSPDFGRKRCAKCAVRPDGVSPSGDTWGDRTPWIVPACRGKTELEKATSPGTKHARKEEPEWPAWVYCTRYSDRPTAGEILDIDDVVHHSYYNSSCRQFVRVLSSCRQFVRVLSSCRQFVRVLSSCRQFVRVLSSCRQFVRVLSSCRQFVRVLSSCRQFVCVLSSCRQFVRVLSLCQCKRVSI